jgi:hypothetical protein
MLEDAAEAGDEGVVVHPAGAVDAARRVDVRQCSAISPRVANQAPPLSATWSRKRTSPAILPGRPMSRQCRPTENIRPPSAWSVSNVSIRYWPKSCPVTQPGAVAKRMSLASSV